MFDSPKNKKVAQCLILQERNKKIAVNVLAKSIPADSSTLDVKTILHKLLTAVGFEPTPFRTRA